MKEESNHIKLFIGRNPYILKANIAKKNRYRVYSKIIEVIFN